MFYFSVSTRGFYLPEQARPADAVEISDDEHASFLKHLNTGGELELCDGKLSAIQAGTSLEEKRAARLQSVEQKASDVLSIGFFVNGLHIALTDASRTDLTAMAATAGFALSGVVTWPESYKLGWISIENIRIPLPTPQEGIALAAAVGDFYARIKQHARTLKDLLLEAADEQELQEVQIETGWPEPTSPDAGA